jgi:molybdate/tungstate transport system substrate-binding protein
MVPFSQLQKEFSAAHPEIDLRIEAHGSIQVIRQVTELAQDVDMVAVADYSLIPMLMYGTPMDNGKPYADWLIEPATNQLGIAFTPRSKYAGEINDRNWFEVLSRPDVRVGLADPRMDAVGYRSIMLTKLAEKYYAREGIFRSVLGAHFSLPLAEGATNGVSWVNVPEVLEPAGNHVVLRGANLQLLSLLESSDVDYTFEYKSVVEQHHLNFLALPEEINLGAPDLAPLYKGVQVRTDFKRFKTVTPVFEGLPIVYGLTVPSNALHPQAAATLLQFLLGPNGRRIFQTASHPTLDPPLVDNRTALPPSLQAFFR